MLFSLMPTEETGGRVRTDCLNFDVSLCIQIKKQISVRGRSHWNYIFCRILDPAAVQDCTKFPSLYIIIGVCYQRYENVLSNKKVVQMLMFGRQNKIWKYNYKSAFDYRFNANKHSHMLLFATLTFWVLLYDYVFFGV